MKKLVMLAAILALVFLACPTDDGNGNGGNGQTTLTITNSSDYNNLVFSYGDTNFEVMNRDQSSTEKTSARTKFIYVIVEYVYQNPALIEMGFVSIQQMFEINDVFTCEEGKNTQFTFTNNTVVTMIGGDSGYRESGGIIKGTLKDIFAGIENYYLHLDD